MPFTPTHSAPFSGESRHASNLFPERPKFTFETWKPGGIGIGGTSSAVSPAVRVEKEEEEDDPVFDNSFVTNVTAQLGKSAHLQCTVLNIKQSNPVSECMARFYLDSNRGLHMLLFKGVKFKLEFCPFL